jgi:uncharacterized delta-60 repeat protein
MNRFASQIHHVRKHDSVLVILVWTIFAFQLFSQSVAWGQSAGSLDPTFTPLAASADPILDIEIQPDGKILLGGDFTTFNDTPAGHIVRLLPDGTLDATFDAGTGADNRINVIRRLSDGSLLVGGHFTSFDGTPTSRLIRLSATGELDIAFPAAEGLISTGFITDINVLADGKMLIIGNLGLYDGNSINTSIARINQDGTLDNSFDVDVIAGFNNITTAIVLADDKILVCGAFTTINGVSQNRIARLETDGSLDETFDPGTGANGSITTMTLLASGRILIGGSFSSYDGNTANEVALLNPDGSFDDTFSSGVSGFGSAPSKFIEEQSGSILVTGSLSNYNGTTVSSVVRLSSAGVLDTDFNTGAQHMTGISDMEIQADDRLIIAGHFTSYKGIARNRIARVFLEEGPTPFVTTWYVGTLVDTGLSPLTIPTSGGGYSYLVNWGDGTTDNTVYTGNAAHEYSTGGTYTVSIYGSFPRILFKNTFVLSVTQWGDQQWQSMEQAFAQCYSFVGVNASDAPDLSAVTSLSQMFESNSSMVDSDLSGWDVSTITNMYSMFLQSGFQGNVSTWDVSNVTEMSFMFYNTSFNGDVSNWNTGNVTSMAFMFRDSPLFNSDISNWDISNATEKTGMLEGASSFDQDLGSWDISNGAVSLSGTHLSPENYSNTLNGWATLDVGETNIPTFVNLQAGGLKYCDDSGRATLVSTYNWNISDSGPVLPAPDVAHLAPVVSETAVESVSPPTGTEPCSGAPIIGQTTATFPIATSQYITWTYTNLDAEVTEQQQYIYIGKPFVTTWQTTTANESITIPAGGGSFSYVVDWGDGTGYSAAYAGDATHEYAAPGIYTVSVAGQFPHISFNNAGDKNKIRTVEQWGDIQWATMETAFSGCASLSIVATDEPDLSAVTSMEKMFYKGLASGDLSGWNVSGIANMRELFDESDFNGDLSTWDVSNVTDMYRMFSNSQFNGDISNWDVSSVTNMNLLFYSSVFNGDLSSWDVSAVATMYGTFAYSLFNGNISDWNVSNVTNTQEMFENSSFSGDISGWDVSNVTLMHYMFAYNSQFHGDLSSWDVSNVTNMRNMFFESEYNQSLASWDISSVTNMEEMFTGAHKLSIENYESTLAGWASLDAGETQVPTGLTLGADGLRYCNATGHSALINDHSWTIVGDVQNCRPTLTSIGNKNVDEDVELTFTVTATDVETATLVYSLDAGSIDKGMVLSATGEFSWTPTNDQTGANEVTFTISDGDLSDSETITITVAAIPDAPVITTVGPKTVNENEPLSFYTPVVDPDSPDPEIVLDAASIEKGMSLNILRMFSWSPTPLHVGEHEVTLTATDDGGLTDTETFTITVVAVNDAPVLSLIGNRFANEDYELTFTVVANDADEDELIFSIDAVSEAAGLTMSPTGEFSWTPDWEDIGGRSVTISVSDGELSDSEEIVITVNAVNDKPVITAIADQQAVEDETLHFVVVATDEDNGTLAYSLNLASTNKGMTINQVGDFYWTPGPAYVGVHEVVVFVSDGVETVADIFNITVTSVNDAPSLGEISNQVVNENEMLSFAVSAFDEDNFLLEYDLDDESLAKGMTISSTGTISWLPTAEHIGDHQVTITVSDGALADSESFTVSVLNVNEAPVLDFISNRESDSGQPLQFSTPATDPDNDNIVFTLDQVSLDKGMALTNFAFTWTPTAEQAGVHQVTVTASDGTLSDSQMFTITVISVNVPRLQFIGDREVTEDQSLSINLSVTDADGPTATYTLDAISLTKGMTLTAIGEFSWTPGQDMVGEHEVTFTVTDGESFDEEVITIIVHEVNDLPVLVTNTGLTLMEGEEDNITSDMLLVTDEETQAESIVYTVTSIPVNGVLLKNGTAVAVNATFTQADINSNSMAYSHDVVADDAFSFTVSDGQGGEIGVNEFEITTIILVGVKTVEVVDVVAYPVPAVDQLSITMVNEYRGRVNFRLINSAGQFIVTEGVSKDSAELSHTMNIEKASSGVHFLQIMMGSQSRALTIFKK